MNHVCSEGIMLFKNFESTKVLKLYCKCPCRSLIPDLFEELEQFTLLEVGTLRAIAAANTFCGRPWGPPYDRPKNDTK